MARYSGKKSRLSASNGTNYSKIHFIIDFFTKIFDFLMGIINFIINNWKRFKVILIGVLAGFAIAFIFILISDFKNVKSLAHFKPNITTKIYDKNNILISELFRQKREIVPIEKIPKNLINAFVSIEDNEFYEHFGVNIKGIVRAFFINIFAGRIRQGGSTITQQLSKILLTSRRRNIYRKIKEACIAIMMELNYSKDEIMALYLNQIYLGHGTYGVESASMLYFNKHVWELNLAESSLIATLPSSPQRLSPIRHPKVSIQRHKIVLAKMVELGFISVKEAEKSYMDFWPSYLSYLGDIAPTLNAGSSRVNRAPWFTEFIRRKLVKKYGSKTVYDKGLLVYTTLDLKKQEAGQKILKPALDKQTIISSGLSFKNDDLIIDRYSDTVHLMSDLFDLYPFRKRGSRENEKLNNFLRNNIVEELEGLNYITGIDSISKFLDKYKKTYFLDKELQNVEGCIVSINQKNGYIETMIGGSEFSSINQLNRVMQMRRQPGSAIKPLLYAAAFESKKFSPASAILDAPVVYLDNEGGDWLPENYEGGYYGLIRLRKALALSINVVSITLGDKLGIDYIMKYYSRLLKFNKEEAKKRIPRNFSISLGSLEVSPFELTRAYAIIANGGKDVIPFSIRYIKDREGKILENREAEVKEILNKKRKNGTIRIIRPDTAQLMISMLRSVITEGTASYASPGNGIIAAGKTGTTNNWKDAWFVGFTPHMTTGMWIGYDRLGLSLGTHQSGGAIAAPIWGKYVREALKNETKRGFPVYASLSSVEVCSRSGLLPASNCKSTIKEIFIHNTVPEKECNVCTENHAGTGFVKKGPRDNITGKQKSAIMRKIRNSKNNSLLKNIEDDLLDDQ